MYVHYFSFCSRFLAAARLRPLPYVFATRVDSFALGYVGSSTRSLINVLLGGGKVGKVQKIIMVCGCAALLVGIVVIGRYIRNALVELKKKDAELTKHTGAATTSNISKGDTVCI